MVGREILGKFALMHFVVGKRFFNAFSTHMCIVGKIAGDQREVRWQTMQITPQRITLRANQVQTAVATRKGALSDYFNTSRQMTAIQKKTILGKHCFRYFLWHICESV